jgi:hypothetical protein
MKTPVQGAAIASENDWSLGCDSYTHFTRIGKGYVCWAVNIVNRGGVLQTRPGKKLILNLPIAGVPQGLCIFRPTPSYGMECLVFAVAGTIYMSRYPFVDYQYVTGLVFDPYAPMIRFCAGKKVSTLNPDGTLQILSQPYNVLIIQDGVTAAGVFDGSHPTGYHIYGGAPGYGTPLGLHMCWSGNRLWVSRDESVFASDFLDPLTFSDSTYLATADNFQLPFPCTGMCETPDERTLLAFCQTSIVSFQSQIADRTMWQQVTDFQKIIVPDTGSVAPRTVYNQFGTSWFLSEFGFTNLNMAQGQAGTDRIPPKDIEMMRSKDNMGADRSMACGTAFADFAMLSVPSGSTGNRHTWIMDAAPQSRLGSQITMFSPLMGTVSWAGVWTGTYPIEYATDIIQGETRCFELSKNCALLNGSHLNIWENFVGQRYDYNDTPIQCMAELRCFDMGTDLYKFRNVEVDLSEIWGEVKFEIWYAGIRGNYVKICEKTIEAEIGIFEPGLVIQYDANFQTDTLLASWRPQIRTIRSEEVSGASEENTDFGPLCGPESVYQQNIDKGFQILFRWTGACGIRQVRIYADPYMEPRTGTCEADEQAGVNIIDEIGLLPYPTVCIVADGGASAVILPYYKLWTTGYQIVNASYELYILSKGTASAPTIVTLLRSWTLGVDVLQGFGIDYTNIVANYAGSQTFYWLFRLGTGQPKTPTFTVNQLTPSADIVSGTANTMALLGANAYYATFRNVDADTFVITDRYVPPPAAAPLYTIDTTNYRSDSYSNVDNDLNYVGVINYPVGLGFQVYQLITVYQPNSNRVQTQTMQLMGSWYEGIGFNLGDVVDITDCLDMNQFPFEFSVLRAGQPSGGHTVDMWAWAGSGNCQLGIEEAQTGPVAGTIIHARPPASLPGVWLTGAPVTLTLSSPNDDPRQTQIAMSLSPSGSQTKQIGFWWPGWDWNIPTTDAFFAGPCGIEVRDTSNNVLQTFVYNRDFGPDGNVAAVQYVDLTALFNAQSTLKIVRFSYYGGSTKTIVMDGDAQGNGAFELGEAMIVGCVYPTDAVLAKASVTGAKNQHVCEIVTTSTSDVFVFFAQNVSTQPRYS